MNRYLVNVLMVTDRYDRYDLPFDCPSSCSLLFYYFCSKVVACLCQVIFVQDLFALEPNVIRHYVVILI